MFLLCNVVSYQPFPIGRGREFNKKTYRRGDGSLKSHAYDYLIDELNDLREELHDTEDTFGTESNEAHAIMSKIRLYEQIRRGAKVRIARLTHSNVIVEDSLPPTRFRVCLG